MMFQRWEFLILGIGQNGKRREAKNSVWNFSLGKTYKQNYKKFGDVVHRV